VAVNHGRCRVDGGFMRRCARPPKCKWTTVEPSERRTEIPPHVRHDDPIRCAAATIRDGLSGDCA
jgi:hypothetical protein